jgi:hypothetical protein
MASSALKGTAFKASKTALSAIAPQRIGANNLAGRDLVILSSEV